MEVNLALLSTIHISPHLTNLPGLPGILATQTPAVELPRVFSGRENKLWCLDFETKGDWADAEGHPVGVALACADGSVYIPLTESHQDTLRVLVQILHSLNIEIIAHNAFFDAGWIFKMFTQDGKPRDGLGSSEPGMWLNWRCSYALYRYLASEGYPGQTYGLKNAQVQLLGWKEKGDVKLDDWLICNGHFSSVSKKKKKGYYFYNKWTNGGRNVQEEGPEECEGDDRWVSSRKEMMYLAPAEILGEYARLDAMSTYDLYTKVLSPVLEQFEGLQWYYYEVFSRVLYTLVWQKCIGMIIDMDALTYHKSMLEEKIKKLKDDFLNHTEIRPHLEAFNKAKLDTLKAKEPAKYLSSWPPKGPKAQFKKDGTVTKAWESYEEKLKAGPTVSKNWLSWKEKIDEMEASEPFNLASGQQRAWLFYEAVGHPIVHTTETGLPKTDETALKAFGEPGSILIKYIAAEKELGFNTSLKGVLNQATMRYHPSFRVPGTHTGRLSGAGGFNAQNPPKSLDFLRCFTVPDDYVIITCDHSSLEDYVLAELSRDMSLWDFYGPNSRKGNCMYLSVGSRLPVLGERIKEAGYNPDSWTPDSVRAAKKKASKWRQVAKAIVLGANYGAGPKTLHKQLTDNNIDIDIEDVFKMYKGFWELRQGVKVWEKELRRQWEDNGGWILNGIGRPICLEPMRDKDLVNATVQSSGHDAHMLFQALIAEYLSNDGFDWYPWHMDMHDCSMFAVRADQAKAACDLLTNVIYPELNRLLGGEISLKGDPNVCITWADDKDEERKWEEDNRVKERINKLRKAISGTC